MSRVGSLVLREGICAHLRRSRAVNLLACVLINSGDRVIAPYFLKRPSPVGFVLGYSRLNPDEISEGIRRLGDVL